MHKHLLAAVLSLAVAMTGASALEAHAKTTFVTIGTGGITGVYYPCLLYTSSFPQPSMISATGVTTRLI